MTRLNAEGHDESQYLPKKWFNPETKQEEPYPIINSCRAAKGDIVQLEEDGGISRAIKWMPDRLYIRGKIKKEDVDTCNSFYNILVGARRTLGICDLRNIISDKGLDIASDCKDTDMFLEIMRGLQPYEANMIIWVVCDEYNHGNLELAFNLIGSIKDAILGTQKIIVDRKSKKA